MTASIRQIDWRPELDAFAPYLADRCGVLQFKFASEDCAANHFSSLLKQAFVTRKGNGNRFSIRIDRDFASTHTPLDILEEFEVQLKRVGIAVAAENLSPVHHILTGNEVAGDMDVSVGMISVIYGNHPSRNDLKKRVDAVRAALREFISHNGRFMIEFRDCPHTGQTNFWHDIWVPLLEEFKESGMVLVHMLGPACQQKAHEDAPEPKWIKTLPTGFATDEARENHAYDDLIDVFRNEGQSDELASNSATTHLAQNLNSVSNLHSNLAAVLMQLRARKTTGA